MPRHAATNGTNTFHPTARPAQIKPGRHRRPRPSHRAIEAPRRPLIVAVVLALLATVLVGQRSGPAVAKPQTPVSEERAPETRADRSVRVPTTPPSKPPPETAVKPVVAKPKPPVDPWANPPPVPDSVAGLDGAQTQTAFTIVWEAGRLGLPSRAKIIAIATALQESRLYVYASCAYPESLDLPHQKVGCDHDSVGPFQQRPSMGWGSVADCMNPATSARIFYQRLTAIRGWASLPVTAAAQAVQRSAFAGAYAQHEALARQIVAELGG